MVALNNTRGFDANGCGIIKIVSQNVSHFTFVCYVYIQIVVMYSGYVFGGPYEAIN